MPVNLVVRQAVDGDAQLIADLTRACWAGTVAVTSSGHRETAQRVAEQLRDGGAFLLLQGEAAVGSVRWTPHEFEPDVWEIRRMGVLPHCRGANLSQHLLEAVIHQGLASGVHELRLAVRSDQPRLIDLYAAYQFDLADELDYSHANEAEPAPRVMRRVLRH